MTNPLETANSTACSTGSEPSWSLTPAEREWTAKQLAALFACYPATDMPQVAWQAALGAYLESLAHWPREVVTLAFRRVRETCKFRPTIAEIMAIGEPLMAQRRRINATDPPRALPPGRTISPERVDELLAPLRKRWGISEGQPIKAPKVAAASLFEQKKAEGQRMFEAWCRERGIDPDAPPPARVARETQTA